MARTVKDDIEDRRVRLTEIYRAYAADPAFASLRGGGNHVVPGRGSLNPRLVLVGEAPGASEAITRQPFRGPAGMVLNDLLAIVGLDRRELFITNVVKYRPTIGEISIRNRTPAYDEIWSSMPYLEREINVFDNVPVVVLGTTPLRALMPKQGRPGDVRIGAWHGRTWRRRIGGRSFAALYHPAYAVYDASRLPIMKQDVAILQDLV